MLDEPVATPMLDHKGIDLRDERSEVRSVFDAVADRAGEVGWRHVPQGGDGQPVYCCHTEVSGKHWVYPVSGEAGQTRPIEFAFGALEIHDSKMGCDLRPIDPAHPRAAEAQAALAACAASHGPTEGNGVTSSYYERGDLGHFTDVGNFAKPLMNKFWAYYNGVFGEDGALDPSREGAHRAGRRALEAVSVLHRLVHEHVRRSRHHPGRDARSGPRGCVTRRRHRPRPRRPDAERVETPRSDLGAHRFCRTEGAANVGDARGHDRPPHPSPALLAGDQPGVGEHLRCGG